MAEPSLFQQYVALAEPYTERYGYAALFAGVAMEGFGIPAPGQSLLIASALLAAKGALNIEAVALVAWTAAVLGDNFGYAIGCFGGRRLVVRAGVDPAHLEWVERFFRRYGGVVVVVARFFDVLRQLNGVVAGIASMPWWLFFACNALGAALWVGVWGLGAYMLGHHLEPVLRIFRWVGPWVIGTGLLALAVLAVVVLRSRVREV
jgi:membrane protein DedA with SNARE-associated domain